MNKTDFNKDVWQYRYGSYYVYEANNETKRFQVAAFINYTSKDAGALWPHYMYESILKTATGMEDLEVEYVNRPFPVKKSLKER